MPRRLLILLALIAPALQATGQILRPPALRMEYHRAERAWRSGSSLAEAKARLDRVLKSLPDDAEAYLLRARVLLDMGRGGPALHDAMEASRRLPDRGEAWLVQAEAALQAGDREAADRALERASSLITEGADHHVRLSWIAQELGQVDRAEAFARIAVALDPDRPAGYVRLAEVFVAQGRSVDARSILGVAMEKDVVTRSELRSHAVLGPVLDRQGNG